MKRSRSSGATRVDPEIHALLGRTLDRRRLVTGSPATVLGAFAPRPSVHPPRSPLRTPLRRRRRPAVGW
jgi:hypothetical protein